MTGGPLDRVATALDRVAPEFVRQRFAAKFAVAFLVVLLVIAGAGVFTFQEASAAVEQQTTEQLAETSQLEGGSIGSWVEQQRTHTRSVSQGEPLRSDRRAAAYILLQDQLLPEDVVSMHLVNDTRGEVVASTELPLEGRSLGELEAPWTTAEVPEGPGNNTAVWSSSRSYRSPVLNDEPVMAFASSVPKREGAHLVVVTRIQSQVDRLTDANSTKKTTILNTADETVLNIDREFDAGTGGENLAAIRDANGTAAPVTTISDGRVYAFAPVPNTQWVTVTSLDTAQAFSVRDTVGESVGLLVLLAVVSLSAIGLVLGKRTVDPLKRLRDRAERIEAGDFDVDLSTTRKDEIGRLYASFDDMRASLQNRIQEAEEAVEAAETARAEAEELRTEAESAQDEAERAKEEAEAASRRLQNRAAEYSTVMQEVAAGDLTKRLDEDAEEAAMREVATEFNAMVDGLEATVGEVAAFADEVASATLEVATGAEEIETTSQTVSERIQEIADGAIRQHDDLEDAAGEMDQLSASIEEVAASATTVAETAEDAVERGETGRAAAESAIEDMAEIESLSADAVDQILALQERMEDIGEIVDFITDIAEQTNMLALNANIEAARADKSGDGFAVVADEVKDLAEETKEAAAEIEAEVAAVQSETDETVADIRATSEHIDTGVETVREAADAIEDTVDTIDDANHGIQEIADATDDQAESTQSVVRRVDEVADISQNVTQDAEQVSAAAEEQSASVAEIARSADELRERADSLAATVGQFDARDRKRSDDDALDSDGDTGDDATTGAFTDGSGN